MSDRAAPTYEAISAENEILRTRISSLEMQLMQRDAEIRLLRKRKPLVLDRNDPDKFRRPI